MNLSLQAKSLWAKTSAAEGDPSWLPLCVHMTDSGEVARLLWRSWLPISTKKLIVNGLFQSGIKPEEAEGFAPLLFIFLAMAHDLGKASPVFQCSERANYLNSFLKERVANAGLSLVKASTDPHHTLISHEILVRHGVSETIAVILGGHHGKPPSNASLLDYSRKNAGFKSNEWVAVQDELFQFASVASGLNIEFLKTITLAKPLQVVLTGLVIMADWISSDNTRFSLIDELTITGIAGLAPSHQRAAEAWETLEFTKPWKAPQRDARSQDLLSSVKALYQQRFGFDSPRPIQIAAAEVAEEVSTPGIFIIEAQTGDGKTELALIMMEILARKFGQGGAFFALPTQATSDGLFKRFENWVASFEEQHTINLMHGKAQFNDGYQRIIRSSFGGNYDQAPDKTNAYAGETVVANDWFQGKKRPILSDFVIGTVDQVLMAGLKQKHLALRHLALANKIVVVDECHAYDAYMSQYLYLVLQWLGAYGVPVIILSATLPSEKRQELIEAYCPSIVQQTRQQSEAPAWLTTSAPEQDASDQKIQRQEPDWVATDAYPLITYTDGNEVKQRAVQATPGREITIAIDALPESALLSTLDVLLEDGGCAGILFNTVKRAQEAARAITEHYQGDKSTIVLLLHSRFIAPDRMQREQEVRDRLGKDGTRPQRMIVIGTQVLEQSLDIDFDVLITQICPTDLLIQRLGRLHRHAGNIRPAKLKEARCFVLEPDNSETQSTPFDAGSRTIYGDYLLTNTNMLLAKQIKLPDEIPTYIQSAYGKDRMVVPDAMRDEYNLMKEEYNSDILDKQLRAKSYQIGLPDGGSDSLIGWLDSLLVDKSGKRGEATVRDTNDSIEVLVVQKGSDGSLCTLPRYDTSSNKLIARQVISTDCAPRYRLAREMARAVITLPTALCRPWNIDATITALERNNIEEHNLACWQDSFWLEGGLFLVLDEEYHVTINGFSLRYSKEYGLTVEQSREEEGE